MANIKSQIKRNRQNDAAHERNKSVKSALKSAVRRFREAADAGNADEARTLAAVAGRKLDKAASAGVIHKNQAANRKSLDQQAGRLALTTTSSAGRRSFGSRRPFWSSGRPSAHLRPARALADARAPSAPGRTTRPRRRP